MKVVSRRPCRGEDRLRPRHERRRQRPREGDEPRARDGVRVRNGRERHLADDARRQLRALGGDEAAARQRAGRLTDHAFAEAVRLLSKHRARARPRRRRRCSRRRRSSREEIELLLADVPRSRARASTIGIHASSRRPAAGRPRRRSIRAVKRAGIHHVGVAVDGSRRGGRDVQATVRRRARAPRDGAGPGRGGGRGARRRRAARAALVARRRHARREVPLVARAGHAPRRLRGRGHPRRARLARGAAAPSSSTRAARRACSGSRSRSSIPIPSTASSRSWCHMAEFVRIEIGFDGGQSLSMLVVARGGRRPRARVIGEEGARLARGRGRRATCRAAPGRLRAAIRARARVGFGAA